MFNFRLNRNQEAGDKLQREQQYVEARQVFQRIISDLIRAKNQENPGSFFQAALSQTQPGYLLMKDLWMDKKGLLPNANDEITRLEDRFSRAVLSMESACKGKDQAYIKQQFSDLITILQNLNAALSKLLIKS